MHLQMTLMVVMTLVSTALGHWRFTHENRSSASGPGLRWAKACPGGRGDDVRRRVASGGRGGAVLIRASREKFGLYWSFVWSLSRSGPAQGRYKMGARNAVAELAMP